MLKTRAILYAQRGVFALALAACSALADLGQYRASVTNEPGLISLYTFEASNAVDTFGTNNGTPVGTTTFGPGLFGSGTALSLGGSGHVKLGTVPAFLFTNGLGTVEAWVRAGWATNFAAHEPVICNARGAAGIRWGIHLRTNRNEVMFYNGTAYPVPIPNASTNWHHLTVTFSNGVQRFYWDGSFVGSTSRPFGTGTSPTTEIGSSAANLTQNYWIGDLDEMAFYSTALDDTRIAAHYNALFGAGAPTFAQQPQSTTNTVGGTAVFTVATLPPTGVSFQWLRNSTNLAGATNATLSVGPLIAADHGAQFQVIASNASGSATSTVATLTVLVPPVFTQQPQSTTNAEGTTAAFTVATSPTNDVTLQWQRNSTSLTGGTNTTLSVGPVTAADDGAQFRVIASNSGGSVTSTVAVLTVPSSLPPAVTYYRAAVRAEPSLVAFFPVDGSIAPGVSNTVNLAFSGTMQGSTAFNTNADRVVGTQALGQNANGWTALTKDSAWDFSGGSGTVEAFVYQSATAGYNPAFFTIRNDSGGGVRYSLHGAAAGGNLYLWNGSSVATWTAPVNMIGRLVHVVVVFSGGTATVYFNGASLGTQTIALGGGVSLPSQIGSAGPSTQESWPGTIDEVALYSSALSASNVANHYNAWLSAPPSIVTQPVSASRLPGQSITFSVGVAGLAPFTYQWFKDTVPLSGATNAILTLTALDPTNSGAYFVTVANRFGSTNSATATLLVAPPAVYAVTNPPPFEWLPQDNGTLADAVIRFNEIMFHPAGTNVTLQWIELQNVMRVDVDMSGWQLDGGVHYTFPSGTILSGGAFLVVAGNLNAYTNTTGSTNVFGPFTGNLANNGERLILRNHDGRLLDDMTYGDQEPWPDGADGSGVTLSKRSAMLASSEPLNWAASLRVGGTPGATNFTGASAPKLAFNELDAATNGLFRLELLNFGSVPLALSNFTLAATTTGATNFPLPSATLNPGQFVVLDQTQFGFHPAQNDKLFLFTSNATVLADAATVKNRLRGRSPDGTGRWVHPTLATFGVSNVGALNRDIVINEIMYEALPNYPSNVFTVPPEQWIELFNRGTNTVSLVGWSLGGGVSFNFPTNTTLAAGAYLVVANDAAALLAAHPGITVLGNLSGNLGHKTDLIELRDANNNLVNEVRHFNAGRWPEYAGGGGSSLELIDPYADNRRAESWAASDETAHGAWQTITYRDVATANPGYDVGYNIWQEFVAGLLDAGEFLLDDVSVIERPGTGQARQLIQNGSFESDAIGATPATWRVLGTHGLHGRTLVESDPDNAGNKVLHVVASGPTDFLHNHLETTLKNGGSIVTVTAGVEYEISLRVKWLAGTRLLNTRLYANWLQRTTVLNAPSSGGTPGAINSRRTVNAGPTYTGFAHAPVTPSVGSNVTVTVSAYDPQGVAGVTLFWRLDGGSWSSVAMSATGGGGYAGVIPGQSAGAKIQFYAQGTDTLGAVSTFPAAGANSRAMFVFNDGLAAVSPSLNYRFVMTAADTDTLYQSVNLMSNHRLGCTIIYNESEVFYDIAVRLKASAYGRTHETATGLSIDFDPDRKFRGAHDSISIERGDSKREILAKHLFNQAGRGVAAGYDDVAKIISPRAGDVGIGLLAMTRTTDTFLDTQYGAGGTVFNFELLYTPTSTLTGDAEAPKLNFPYSHVSGEPDMQDLGNDKETYRWNFQLRNNRVQDDSALMIAAAQAFDLSGAALDARTRDLMDVQQWLRCFGMESLLGNGDFYTRWWNHNLRFYQRPGDNRLVALPWDLDRSFTLGTSETLWGAGSNQAGFTNRMRKLIEYPVNLRTYYANLLDLIGVCYNSAYATRWANHYATLTGDSGISGFSSYIANRGAFALSQIPTNTPFSITTSNGANFSTGTNLVTLVGTAPVGVQSFEVNGETVALAWTSLTNWTLQLALPTGANALTLQGFDLRGNVVTSALDTITVNVTAPVDDPVGKVVINEIMYNPSVAGASFVEIHNSSTTTAFDLSGWRLDGVGFAFAEGTMIAPGGFLLVVANRVAFVGLYGSSLPVVGEFPGTLDNGGETLQLIKPGPSPLPDVPVDAVRYNNDPPWPVSAAGGGASLQLIDPLQDNSRVGNWSAATPTPGIVNSVRTTLPAFPTVWLNEAQADNVTGPTNSAGQHGAWVELFNAGASTVSLSGLCLSGNYTNLTNWAFPTNASIAAGQFLVVWCDGGTNTPGGELHASFSLPSGGGSIALARLVSGSPQLVDYLNYHSLPANWSFGDFHDGQPFERIAMFHVTPGATNNGAAPPLTVFINEWMADNTRTLANPASGKFDDWFEIYNPGTNAVDLGGYYLSDSLTNQFLFHVPDNGRYVIPPSGFLFVWADGKPSRNNTNDPALHADFQLNKDGEAIAIFASDGTPIDAVFFGLQTNDISQGRFPDGAATVCYLPTPTPGAVNQGPVQQVSGQVELEGYGGPALNGIGTRLLTFKATDGTGTVLHQWDLVLNFARGTGSASAASFILTNVPITATHLSAKSAWNLRKRQAFTFSDGSVLVDFTGTNRLPGGDIDNSNHIDLGDFNQLAAFWYTSDAASDINGSGLVDIEDYFLLARRWYQQGDTE